MSKILILGAGSLGIAVALRALDGAVRAEDGPSRQFAVYPSDFEPGALGVLGIPTEDPFTGGGRSKGEKKRAARERRMRGGY